MKKFIILLLLFCLMQSICQATNYYVDDTTGDNGDSGLTEALAFATIAYGLTQIDPLDILWIKFGATAYTPDGGPYTIADSDVIVAGYYENIWDLDPGGTWFLDWDKEPVIDMGQQATDTFLIVDFSGVSFRNIHIQDMDSAGGGIRVFEFNPTEGNPQTGNGVYNCWINSTIAESRISITPSSQRGFKIIGNRFSGNFDTSASSGIIIFDALTATDPVSDCEIAYNIFEIDTSSIKIVGSIAVNTVEGVTSFHHNLITVSHVSVGATLTTVIDTDYAWNVYNNTIYAGTNGTITNVFDFEGTTASEPSRVFNNIYKGNISGIHQTVITLAYEDYNAYDGNSGETNGFDTNGFTDAQLFESTATGNFRPVNSFLVSGGQPFQYTNAVPGQTQDSYRGALFPGNQNVNVVTVSGSTPMTTDDIWDEDISDNNDAASAGDQLNDTRTDVAAILIDTDEIGTAGVGLSNIDLPNQTMNITGTITTVTTATNLTNNNDKTGYALSSAGEAGVTNDWETQSQANPGNFHVFVWDIDNGVIDDGVFDDNAITGDVLSSGAVSKIQSGLATASALTTHDNKIGTPVDLGSGTTIANNLANLSDNNDGEDYDPARDSNYAIRTRGDTAWLTGAGATASETYNITSITRTVGDNDGGDDGDVNIVNGTYFSTGEINGDPTLTVDVVFTADDPNENPITLFVWAFYNGGPSHHIDVLAETSDGFEKIGEIANNGAVINLLSFALTPQHIAAGTGVIAIKFDHDPSASTQIIHVFSIDKIIVTTAVSSITAANIEEILVDTSTTLPGKIDTTDGLIGALNDFDPANDDVAVVTLVNTTTTNTDVRGTDNAATESKQDIMQIDLDTITGTNGVFIDDNAINEAVFYWEEGSSRLEDLADFLDNMLNYADDCVLTDVRQVNDNVVEHVDGKFKIIHGSL